MLKLLAVALLAFALAGSVAVVGFERSNQAVVCDPCG